jgi:hypothetical protein
MPKKGDSGRTDYARIVAATREIPPGKSIRVTKAELPELPGEFEGSWAGTPLWIAHPGSKAQYRAYPAQHAYELEEEWEFHRDRFDPKENPLGHIIFDAPEIVVAGIAAAIAGVVTFLFLQGGERDKDESERHPWFPALVAVGIAAFVGFIVYVLGALVRVALGAG